MYSSQAGKLRFLTQLLLDEFRRFVEDEDVAISGRVLYYGSAVSTVP
jgi:hypothetical protein